VPVPTRRHAGDLDRGVIGRRDRGQGCFDSRRQREQGVEAGLRGPRTGRGVAGVDHRKDDLGERERKEHEQGGDRAAQVSGGHGRRDDDGHGGDGGAATGQREQPAQTQPPRALDAAPGHLVARLGDGAHGAVAGLPHHQLVRHLGGLHDALGEAGPGCDAPALTASRTEPGDHMGETPDGTGGRDDQPGAEVEVEGHRGRQGGDEDQATDRHPAPELSVEHAVDVVDDRRQDVATARAQPPGRERHERVVHLGPAASEHAQGRVV
jgi:hypothetical protein